MARVVFFSSVILADVAKSVEKFLNSTDRIQILDISWFTHNNTNICTITYFEV